MSQIAADAPYVDLRREPYGVVVNDQLAAAHNTVAINAAIADHSGPGARLVMPTGVLYLEQANPGLGPAQRTWSIKGSPGTSNIRLCGQGWRQTKLIQAGVGTGGEWNGIVMDGVTGVSLEDFSIEQGTIDNPAYALHALIQIGAYSGFGTKDVSIRGVYFGQCIGDALRVLGDGANGPLVDTLLVDHFVMRTQGHPYGNAGLGQGSRSGISFQRGARNVIISNGYIEGAANSPSRWSRRG